MSPRTGRPKVDNPKTIRYSICIDAETEKKLTAYCESHKVTKGEAVRAAIIQFLDRKK